MLKGKSKPWIWWEQNTTKNIDTYSYLGYKIGLCFKKTKVEMFATSSASFFCPPLLDCSVHLKGFGAVCTSPWCQNTYTAVFLAISLEWAIITDQKISGHWW